jgi:hypothetical protein
VFFVLFALLYPLFASRAGISFARSRLALLDIRSFLALSRTLGLALLALRGSAFIAFPLFPTPNFTFIRLPLLATANFSYCGLRRVAFVNRKALAVIMKRRLFMSALHLR